MSLGLNTKRSFLFFFVLIFVFSFSVTAQSVSNEGTDFWVCFPAHVPSLTAKNEPRVAKMSVFITSKSNSSGKITCGNFSTVFSVTANTVTEIEVPREDSYIENEVEISKNKGIHVTVDAGKPRVVVYAHVFAGARSAATLVLPTEALGQKYYAIAYTQDIARQNIGNNDTVNVYSQFNVIAADDNTLIRVTPVLNGKKQAAFEKKIEKKGDVYSYQHKQDITGSLIEVHSNNPCNKIAVFSGSSALTINPSLCKPAGHNSADPLFQQLYPIENWGKTFALIPFYNRLNGSIYRVLASEDNTEVIYGGRKITIEKAGAYHEIAANYNVDLLHSDKPVMVAQYALSQYCADQRNQVDEKNTAVIPSDPDMVILNPLEYNIDRVTLYSSTKLDISEQYINVTIPTVKVSSFRMNDMDMTTSFKSVPGQNDYSYAQIPLHLLGKTNFSLYADTGFNAMAYGFGNVESYAYSAGTNLVSTKAIYALKKGTDVAVREGCIKDLFDFKLLVPYEVEQLIWKVDTDQEIIVAQPTGKPVVVGEKILYEYRLTANKSFAVKGIKRIYVRAVPKTSANACVVNAVDEIESDIEIIDVPVVDFSMPETSCIGEEVSFLFKEIDANGTIKSWAWDFGDGNLSAESNPKHVYKKSGEFEVKLTVVNQTGCSSVVVAKKLFVPAGMVPNFSVSSSLCEGVDVQFEDKTIQNTGDITGWEWDFGDQTSSVLQHPKHTFAQAGKYEVKLSLTNKYGCTYSVIQTVEIFGPANIDFENEKSCINDIVVFKAKSTGDEIVSWEWDFGDGSHDVLQKYRQQAQHQYAATGEYLVTLSAVSKQGCNSVLQKKVIISGDNPQPVFEVPERVSCSEHPIQLINKSFNTDGVVTKVEWLLDYGNGNTLVLSDTDPFEGKVYTYRYPALPIDKSYKIVLRVYSGVKCYRDSAPIEVKIYGKPSLTLNLAKAICVNAGPFKLDGNNLAEKVLGQGKFEGKGVVGNVFYPDLAGVGRQEVIYTFLSNNGCTDTLRRFIEVQEKPELEQFEAFDILLGGEKKLDLKLKTRGKVNYQWYPAEGLSADNILNPVASPSETTRYILTLTSEGECVNSYEVLVNVHLDPFIPNAFSPNGDGFNDAWSIKYLETFTYADIRIFNRYGQEVFYSKRYTDAWHGKLNGVDVPVGVYYYIIEPNNGRRKYTGSLTLIR